ncbi:MAG: ATP-binding protein [Alphaproteobacteria bacterium]
MRALRRPLRRLWPRSIAGRNTLVLIAGLLIVIWASTMVWWLSVARGDGPPGSRIAFETAAGVAAMIDRMPPEIRARALDAATGRDLKLSWSKTRPAGRLRARRWETRWIARRMRESLSARGLTTIEVGTPTDRKRRGEPLVAHVRLTDGSWLSFSVPERMHGPPRPGTFLATIAVIALGAIGLAVLVSRRVTRPLRRFSAAAARLGTDVDAPPMDEAGPSEIREAAEAFNQMQRRIRRFVEDRTRMLAAISHDLRTMLTRFQLRADYIEDNEQRAKAVEDIARMREMLDATLSLARDDAAAEPTTAVDLSSLLQTLCDDLADAGHTVAYAGPDRVTLAGRPVALGRAVANLIDNAVKYGGEAEVHLEERTADVVITVADRGPGIPAGQREQVFAPFFRLEQSRSRETGGTGLGLALARNIVRGHGGDITLEDREGGGLVARVVLPRGVGGP